MIELEEARRRLLADCPRLEPVEVAVADALDCVLAADVVSGSQVPPFDNSSLDGYAVRAADLGLADRDHPVRLQVLGMVAAGHVADRPIEAGQTWKVMTGAPLPAGADTVVMVENSSAGIADPLDQPGDEVALFAAPTPGTGVRRAGGDLQVGDLVFPRGTVLRAAHLGVLASVGIRTVPAWRRLRVGVLVTGDELVTSDRPLGPGEIYESNRPMLIALLRSLNCEPVDLGIAVDDVAELKRAFSRAATDCDVVLTSGGVSMGDADPVKAALAELGRLNWLQVAIRPAKPFAYGVLDGATLVLGLPGNPVSSLVSFILLAAPTLRRMMGHDQVSPEFISAISDSEFPAAHPDGRTTYLRARAKFGPDGRLHVRPVTKQDSHQLSATADANALVRVPPGHRPAAGATVDALLLHQ